MNKKVLLSLPDDLYQNVKRLASRKYRSASSLIRESILEKIEDEFTPQELAIVEQGFRSIDAGKGADWRKIMKHIQRTFIFGLLAISCLCAGAEKVATVDTLQELVSKWVDLKKEIGREEEVWKEQKEILKQGHQLLLKEKVMLEVEIADVSERQTSAEKERAELLKSKKELKDALSSCLPALTRAEAELQKLTELIPSALRKSLEKGIRKLTSSAPQDIPKRLRIAVGAYKEIERLENQIHLIRETLEVEKGNFREMDVIYLGLSQGYAVSLDGEMAGVGRPSMNGWIWEWRAELSDEVKRAISCYKRQSPPDFVHLPLKIVNLE